VTKIASLILPAHNEAELIQDCINSVLTSDLLPNGWSGELIVIANGCSDGTARVAQAMAATARHAGWPMTVIDTKEGGKLKALNTGESQATGQVLIYLDADVVVDPTLLSGIVATLDTPKPRYASGIPRVSRAKTWVTRAYARIWTRLPFVQTGVPGFGIFAMNRAGRAAWDAWPDIISDDTFARLNFRPEQRSRVDAGYSWPMVEGFANLVRVRRRQDAGVQEIQDIYPDLCANDDTPRADRKQIVHLAISDPIGFAVYGAVALAVKTPLFRGKSKWARGR
jgi:glycosyltransferase involved in cell wall biosynthesis